MDIADQVYAAAAGMHGAGGYRAQCGLVEGMLMFLGIAGSKTGLSRKETAAACYQYAEVFEKQFGSLLCRDLRPEGFSANNPPHLCENLTCRALLFAVDFLQSRDWL